MMRPGQQVTVKAFGGKTLARTVVQVIDNTVVICRHQEWAAAKRERREPVGIGFPKHDVLLKIGEKVGKV